MVITSSSFENPPPKSLDKAAAARVSKVTTSRDKSRRESRNRSVAPLPESQVSSQERPEVIESIQRQQSVAPTQSKTRQSVATPTDLQRARSFSETKATTSKDTRKAEQKEKFIEQVQAQKERQEKFQSQEGFQRIRNTAEFFTPKPIRGTKVGEVFTGVTEGFMGGGIQAGGAILGAGEKTFLTSKGLFQGHITLKDVRGEAKRASFETMKIFDPRTTEGQITLTTAALGAFTGVKPQKVKTRAVSQAETFSKTDLATGDTISKTTQDISIQAGKKVLKVTGEADTSIRMTSETGAIGKQESFIKSSSGDLISTRRLDTNIIIEGERTTAFGSFLETVKGKKDKSFVGTEKSVSFDKGGPSISTTESLSSQSKRVIDPLLMENVLAPPKTKGRPVSQKSVTLGEKVLEVNRMVETPAELVVTETPFGSVEMLKPSSSKPVRETVSVSDSFIVGDKKSISTRDVIPRTEKTFTEVTESGLLEVNIKEGIKSDAIQVTQAPALKPLKPFNIEPPKLFTKEVSTPSGVLKTSSQQSSVRILPTTLESQALRAVSAETPSFVPHTPVVTTQSLSPLSTSQARIPTTSSLRGLSNKDLGRGFVPLKTFQPVVTPKLDLNNDLITVQKPSQVQKPFQDKKKTTGQVQQPKLLNKQVFVNDVVTVPKQAVIPAASIPPVRNVRLPMRVPLPVFFLRQAALKPRFQTQVRVAGKFQIIGSSPTFGGAFKRGAERVGTTPLRSFRIISPKGVPTPSFPTVKLRKAKRDPFTFVERSKFAIDTTGEVTGISKKKRRRNNRR